jgi:ubiquinone/menaquinone biosynthesis C-methylase UbiE
MPMIPMMENLRRSPNRGAALASYARLAARYDRSCRWLDAVRFEALELLAAREGETVIDVACGSGAMLPSLGRAVGSKGRVIGIEQCPEMAALARERVALAGLKNVEIINAPVEDARLELEADALLFCYAHDVQQSDDAVARVLRAARPGARIVAAGARLISWWAAPVNLWKLWRSRHYVTTYRGLKDPASRLALRCPDWRVVDTHVLGTSYLAVGHVDTEGRR